MTNNYRMILHEVLALFCDINDSLAEENLLLYMEQVIETNKSLNLTAITEPEDFIIKHFADSLAICKSAEFKKAQNIIDVGTGAGFPGMPLAILYPEKNFVLMDSLNKRIAFLENCGSILKLDNIECIHARAEELGHSRPHREKYDICVSRAVARLSVLSEYCLPLVKKGGCFIPYKTGNENISDAENALNILGGNINRIEAFPEINIGNDCISNDHILIYINKTRNTPAKYPRKPGTPGKEPL